MVQRAPGRGGKRAVSTREALLAKWRPRAQELESASKLPVPFHVLEEEALTVAKFFEVHWKTRKDADGSVVAQGLEMLAGGEGIGDALGTELLELLTATQGADAAFRLAAVDRDAAGMRHAQAALREIRAVIEFALGTDPTTANGKRVQRLRRAHPRPRSEDALASALYEYAELARRNRTQVVGLGGFDADRLEQASALATQLRERSADRISGDGVVARRAARELRDRLATLLYERMQRVRAAARFLYRDDPARLRQVTSSYQRRKRAANRRAARETGGDRAGE